MSEGVQILKALADESRLRIVRLLLKGPLHVNEILEVLQMGQSRVSRHLKILADAGLLAGRREGSRIYYGISPEIRQSALLSSLETMLGFFESREDGSSRPGLWLPEESLRDYDRLANVLDARKSQTLDHFFRYGALQDEMQRDYVDADYYRNEIIEMIPEGPLTVVDLGCGTGELAVGMTAPGRRIILVDQSQAMLDQAVAEHVTGDLSGADAARVKLFCTEVAGRVIDRCLQLHGGYGYITEYPIARLYADTRVSRIYGGTSEVMKTIIAKDLGL